MALVWGQTGDAGQNKHHDTGNMIPSELDSEVNVTFPEHSIQILII